jgi:hypothetical protein
MWLFASLLLMMKSQPYLSWTVSNISQFNTVKEAGHRRTPLLKIQSPNKKPTSVLTPTTTTPKVVV